MVILVNVTDVLARCMNRLLLFSFSFPSTVVSVDIDEEDTILEPLPRMYRWLLMLVMDSSGE